LTRSSTWTSRLELQMFVRFTQIICSCVVAVFLCNDTSAAAPIDSASVGKLLDEDRLFDLMPEVARNQWQMPPILSQWAIQRRPADQRTQLEHSSEFAHKLALQLDRLAPSLRQQVSLNNDDAVARWLVALADWLASTPASGNAILADRALDLATIPLARLAIAPTTPQSMLSEYERMLQPAWASVAYRAQALNTEVGSTIFAADGTDDEMKSVYNRESAAAALASMTAAGVQPTTDEVRQMLSGIGVALDRSGFFAPESFPASATTSNRLGMKNAGSIVAGLGDGNATELLAVIKYRLRAGTLPAIPKGTRASNVLTDEWEKQLSLAEMEDAQLRTLGGRAGRAFDRIADGKFIDHDSFESRREPALTKPPLPVPANLQVMSVQSSTLPTVDTSTDGARVNGAARNTKDGSNRSDHSGEPTRWSIIVVLIVAAVGLLWLVLKRRS
jgi:hypothetical protein